MNSSIVAKRYAGAMFFLAKKHGKDKLETIGKNLNEMNAACQASAELGVLFRDPLFSGEEKFKVMRAILEKLASDRLTVNFCHLLAEKGRLPEFGQIVAVFNELLDAENAVYRGELVTAVKLDAKKCADLQKKLEQQTNRSLALDYTVDPAIIGGVILKLGDQVLDASLRAQLLALKENIKRGESIHAN